MVSSRPTSKPEAQNPPTVDPPARGTPWRQWLEPVVVVTFLSALLVILASAGSAGFQVLRSDIIASETRQREDIKDLKADVKEDIADLKADNEDFKASLKEDIADIKAANEDFKASIKENVADIKLDVRALNDKLDRLLEHFLAAKESLDNPETSSHKTPTTLL